jgi:hypothetical protein
MIATGVLVAPDPLPPPISPFGRKTNAREMYNFRFSQELPARYVFRKQMAPQKSAPSTSDALIQQTACELENAHMLTKMPPSLHIPPETRKRQQRAPKLVHGTFYQEPRSSSPTPMSFTALSALLRRPTTTAAITRSRTAHMKPSLPPVPIPAATGVEDERMILSLRVATRGSQQLSLAAPK